MSPTGNTPDANPSIPQFLPVHGRLRAYDRLKQAIKRASPDWLVSLVQSALSPYTSARNRALHRQRIHDRLPGADAEQMLALVDDARARWGRGERDATGPLVAAPLGRSDYRVWLRPGTCDVILYDDIVVQEQYGSLPLGHVRTILDAGANIGLASAYFLWRCPQARVVALEPDPVNHELCLQNLAPFRDRAVVLRAGVWDRPCRIRVEAANLGTWASTTALAEGSKRETDIEAFDIATLLDRHGIETLDLLKMDIEGVEREIFAAEDLRWLDRVRCIQIELEPSTRETFFRAVRGRGFEFVQNREVTVAVRPGFSR